MQTATKTYYLTSVLSAENSWNSDVSNCLGHNAATAATCNGTVGVTRNLYVRTSTLIGDIPDNATVQKFEVTVLSSADRQETNEVSGVMQYSTSAGRKSMWISVNRQDDARYNTTEITDSVNLLTDKQNFDFVISILRRNIINYKFYLYFIELKVTYAIPDEMVRMGGSTVNAMFITDSAKNAVAVNKAYIGNNLIKE